jgi:uncharacterized integral membrane protein
MTGLPVVPDERSPEPKRRGRKLQVLRLVGLLALCGFVADFIVENSQNVSVKLWFVTEHQPLIFVVIGCLLFGALVGYISGRRRGESWLRRRLRKKVQPEL